MRKRKRWILLIYLILLGVSWLVMSKHRVPLPPGVEWREIAISPDHGKLRYRKFEGSKPQLAPLIFIHGSPMASSGFDPLLDKLPRDRTILVPDLPGFGASSTGFSDCSFTGHAAALDRLIDHENAGTAHWVAYSQGGGPVLELAARRPAAFASLTLLSSIGAIEYELTGDYFLNHILHGAQWIALEALRWGIPHFGVLDKMMINTRYARNFYQGDMRPLRRHLESFNSPVLIIHGEDDGLVVPGAAREHFRILPQSELVWLSGGHLVLMTAPGSVTESLQKFLIKVDTGKAVTRASAGPSRQEAASRPFDPVSIMGLRGAVFWLTLLGIALATLASEDLACLAAGLLAGRGLIPLPAAIFASFAGIWIGDMALYALGRYGGGWLTKRGPMCRLMNGKNFEAARAFLHRRGATAIFLSRFTPGMRLPLYVAVGIVKVPALKLGLWFMLAGLAWTIPVVGLTAWFGQRASDWLMHAGVAVFPTGVALLLGIWFLLRLVSLLVTHRGRRILRARWLRIIRWEFWPPIAFYVPVVLAVIGIGLRRRNLLVFTAVNPAIPHGGVSGESKTLILKHLEKSGCVAPFVSLPAGTRNGAEIVRKSLPDFPLVVKPDVGERGTGVVIVHDCAQLVRELESRNGDTIVQSYVEGAEFGVFYIRHPHESSGWIFSITIKLMTSITGDGMKTLDELILDDDRASLNHRYFAKIYQDNLAEIPPQGETIVLAGIGSHCRGALFLDGAHLITSALEAEIERIARTFDGFYFGRFDLRCPDEDSLKRGEGIRLIELNGVTSEATHIYHPHTPLLRGYRTLIQQWRHAYDIGVANAANGARVSNWGEFCTILRNHLTRKSN